MGNKITKNQTDEHNKLAKLDKIRTIGIPRDFNSLSPKSFYNIHQRLPHEIDQSIILNYFMNNIIQHDDHIIDIEDKIEIIENRINKIEQKITTLQRLFN